MKAKIAPALKDQRVPIDSVEPHPRNTMRQHDVGAISESYRKFGQLRPIVCQATPDGPRIVAGKGQWLAAKALGWAEIAVVVHDLDDATALAFIVADNRSQELGSYDQDALATVLTELAAASNLRGTGYDGGDVDQLLYDLGQLPGQPGVDKPPKGADDVGVDAPSQYAVAVLCDDEPHQRQVFEALEAAGYRLKVLAV